MISTQFKKSIIKRLKDDYNVVCHSIRMEDKDHNSYQEYSLSCSARHQLFTLNLILNICPVDSPNESYYFYVFAKSDCVDNIPHLKDKLHYENVVDAIQEVRDVLNYISPLYEFKFLHNDVTIISGIYFEGSSYFEIKSLKNVLDINSVIMLYDFINSGRLCSQIKITDNKIYVSPCISHCVHPTFTEYSSILSGDLYVFKANFAKSVVLFFNENCRTADNHNDEEDDYLPLNYEDLKRYLLVHNMCAI